MHSETLSCWGKDIVFKEGKSSLRTGNLTEGPGELTAAEPLEPLIRQKIAVSKGENNRGR